MILSFFKLLQHFLSNVIIGIFVNPYPIFYT